MFETNPSKVLECSCFLDYIFKNNKRERERERERIMNNLFFFSSFSFFFLTVRYTRGLEYIDHVVELERLD